MSCRVNQYGAAARVVPYALLFFCPALLVPAPRCTCRTFGVYLVLAIGWGGSTLAQDWVLPTHALLQPAVEDPDLEPPDPIEDVLGGIDPLASSALQPTAPSSLLLERLEASSAGPADVGFSIAEQPPAIETVEVTRNARIATSRSGVRRSQVSIQPVIRGYGQQSILGQYQGAQFVPVRFDLDSFLTSLDPGIIENVVIIPGPYGVKHGPGLAFIDVAATPLPRSESFEWRSTSNLLYRSNGGQFYGRETVAVSNLGYGARASYGQKAGSDYRAGDGTRIPSSYEVADVNVAVNFDVTDESTLQFEYLFQDMSDTEFAGLAFDARARETEGFFLRYHHESQTQDVQVLAEGWYNRTVFAGDNLTASKQAFYQPNLVFVPAGSYIGFTDADVTSSGMRVAPTFGSVHGGQLAMGVDFRFLDGELNEFDDFVGFFDSFPVPRSHMIDFGAFAELSLPRETDGKVTVGGRVDWVFTHQNAVFSSFDPTGVEHIFDFGNDFDDQTVLYHVFVSSEEPWGDELTVRAGVGHGQRPPNLTERFAEDPFLTLIQNATSAVVGDAFLEPERATQLDVALVGETTYVQFQLGGFVSYIDDHITLAPAIGIPPDPDLRLFDFVNEDAVLAGAEFATEVQLTMWYAAFASVSYIDGRNIDRGEPLPSIYPLQGRCGILWREPDEDRYGCEFRAWIVDNQDRLASSLLEQATPGFARFDLLAYCQASDQVRITTGFENIGNRAYVEHLSVHNPLVLEPGFQFYLATRIDL